MPRPIIKPQSLNLLTKVKYLVSNIKWILISLKSLIINVENWYTCFIHFLFLFYIKPLKIKFRNGLTLLVPEKYLYESIAETLLLNVYGLNCFNEVVVDIGAGIGDFTLLASQKSHIVYAIEPDEKAFQYLKKNIAVNKLKNVISLNIYANKWTLKWLLANKINQIGFLKIDCEGCEYEVLSTVSNETISKINYISMEIHEPPPCTNYTRSALINKLSNAGFKVKRRKYHGGYYAYFSRS